jgi:hypothetical protein
VNYASLAVYSVLGSAITILGAFAVPYVQADYIDAGAVTAKALAADAVTATSIEAGAVTATALAAGSVTTTALAAGSVTTTALAANAVTAVNIKAGAITTAALTVCDWTNLCYNPSFSDGLSCWSSGNGSVSTGTEGGHDGGTATALIIPSGLGTFAIRNTNLVPVSGEQTYTAQAYVYLSAVPSSGGVYIRLRYLDTSGNEVLTQNTAVYASTGWSLLSITGAVPSNASLASVNFEIVSASLVGATALVEDCYLRRCMDAAVIVDGSISASKLVVGAAVADIETVGSLTAGVIYFTDGFCLNTLEPKEAGANVTSAHVLTASAALSSSVSTPASLSSAWTTATGFGWTVAASAAADVYNISGCLSLSCPSTPTTSNYFDVGISIDGADPTAYMRYYSQQTSSAQRQVVPMVQSITGLAAGSHSLTVAFRSDGGSQWKMQNTGSSALCQRIY